MKSEIKNFLIADFETKGENFYKEHGFTEVWLYAICNRKAEIVNIGYSIDDFFDYIRTLKRTLIYFHNLRFDSSFILDYLFRNGFEYKEKIGNKDKNCFTCLIGEQGEFYSLRIKFNSYKIITFEDSLKLLPFKEAKIAKDFNLDVKKGKIDYENYVVNDETIKYVCDDVKIIAKALDAIKEYKMNKMTVASSAYNTYKDMLGIKNFNSIFPELNDDILNNYRDCYRGGRCQVNSIYQNKILHNVYRFDINSMYPYIMRNFDLPCGDAIKIKEMGKYKFEIYKIEVGFYLKDKHIPSLMKRGGLFNKTDTYYINSDGIETIYISSPDFELLKRNYDIYYLKFIEGYGFNTCKFLFRKYVDYFYELKNTTTGAQHVLAKLMLNSLYGKFGSNYIRVKKNVYYEDGLVKFINSEPQHATKYYLPVALAIVSYAHLLIDNAIHAVGYENFVYCDTDSIHTLVKLDDSFIDQKELGKFKLEGLEEKSKYVRQKTYLTKENGMIKITAAGMPDDLKNKAINMYGENLFDVFQPGFSIDGKLLQKRVKGGIILTNSTFSIK